MFVIALANANIYGQILFDHQKQTPRIYIQEYTFNFLISNNDLLTDEASTARGFFFLSIFRIYMLLLQRPHQVSIRATSSSSSSLL